MQGTYGVDNIILDLDIVDVNAVDTVLCRPYYFRTCDCRPNSKRNCRPKSVELMDGSRLWLERVQNHGIGLKILRDRMNCTVVFANCFVKVPLACLGSRVHKAAGLVHQWNSEKTVSKPHCTVHFVS